MNDGSGQQCPVPVTPPLTGVASLPRCGTPASIAAGLPSRTDRTLSQALPIGCGGVHPHLDRR